MTRDRSWQRTTAGLAAAIVAIGAAVVFALGGAGVPEPAPASPAGANDESPPAVAFAHATPATEPSARATAAVPTRALRIRVLQRLGKTTAHYTGPLRVVAGDDEVLATTLRNGLNVALEVAGDATELRVEAPGFAACDVALGGRDTDATVREVVLVPDSGLRFCFVCPGAGDGAIRVAVFRSDTSAWSEQRACAGAAEAVDVPILRGEQLRWVAQWQANGQWCDARGDEPALAGGEHRRVLVDFAAVRMQRHRVVGPSPALLPHLVVTWPHRDAAVNMSLGADGAFERPAAVTAPVQVWTAGSLLELRPEPAGDTIVWRPPQPLLGVGLVDAARALVSTQPVHPTGHALGPAARVHAFPRSVLPRPLGLRTNSDLLQFLIDADGANDLVLLTAADALAPTRLVVELSGEPPAEPARKGLSLSVCCGDGAEPIARSAAPRLVFDLPRGGEYTLAWRCTGAGERDATSVHVEAGREQVATLAWPSVCAWTGEVAGWDELPAVRRWHRIGFGAESARLHAGPHRVDERGRFEFVRFAEQPPCEPATLGWGLVPVAARIVVCDETNHHVVVQPAEALRWIDVDVEAQPPWRLVLYRAGAPGATPRVAHVLGDRQQLPVPLAGTDPLFGALFQGEGSAPIAWCELRGDAPRVTVRAEPLRRVEVRSRTARAGRQVYLVGPSGQWDLGHELATTETRALDAPATTRGVAVCEPGAAPREVALGAGGAVVID